MYNITNKKYQKVKILLNESESVVIEGKGSKKINIIKPSEHMMDLEKNGFISLKKIEKTVNKKIEKVEIKKENSTIIPDKEETTTPDFYYSEKNNGESE